MEIDDPRKMEGAKNIGGKKSEKVSSGRRKRPEGVNISSMAQFMEEISKLPDVRIEKILKVKEQIAKGEYETEEKINIAIERILKEIS